MAFSLSLEQEDVQNVLSCIDGTLADSQSDLTKIALGSLISKIESQTGVALEQYAPRAVPKDVVEKLRKKISDAVGPESARPFISQTPNVCTSHSIDLFGEKCPRCGVMQ